MSKPTIWTMPNRIEREYSRALRALAQQIRTVIGTDTDPYAAVRRLRFVTTHPPYREYCDSLALKMATHIQTRINGTWRTAAQHAGRGGEFYRDLMVELQGNGTYDAFVNLVRENAEWIKSFPRDIAEELTVYIQEQVLKGRRSSDIAQELGAIFDDWSQSKMTLIARTETSKTQTALTQVRAERLGLSWYIWRTSEDARIRSSHVRMDGVLIRWAEPPRPELLVGEVNPPSAYHAGEIYNCRCYPEPVIDLGFVDFPARIFNNGRIQSMTRAQFEKIV
jgi:SPP1 gp7 family putative phage head morphogenesis protein